jgi:hypothetical protein
MLDSMAFDQDSSSQMLRCGDQVSTRTTEVIMNSFECVDAFISDQDAYDNAMASLQNSTNF